MLLELLRLLSGCYYLVIYAYDVKTASICLYEVLFAKLNPNFIFPNFRPPKIGFPTFHSESFSSCLVLQRTVSNECKRLEFEKFFRYF